jgi:hypothetical protein
VRAHAHVGHAYARLLSWVPACLDGRSRSARGAIRGRCAPACVGDDEVIREHGGGERLVLHLAYATDRGFDLTEVWESKEQFDAFNQEVFPQAMARAGVPMNGPAPETLEFEPAGVMTPRAYPSDAVS